MTGQEKVKEDRDHLLTAIDVAEHYLTPKARREIAKQIPRGEMKRIITVIEFFSGVLDELLSSPEQPPAAEDTSLKITPKQE